MFKIKEIITLMRDAIYDYISHTNEQKFVEWLQEFFKSNLPGKSLEEIKSISSEILDTIAIMETKQYEMEEAMVKGVSPENWMVKDIMNESGGNGEKAKKAVAFFSGAVCADKSFEYTESIEVEAQENEDEHQDYSDSKWNDYALKDMLKGVTEDIGIIGIKSVTSDFFRNATEDSFECNAEERGNFPDFLIGGALKGAKVALSAALVVAEERGIIPKATVKVLATTAHKTIESLSVISDVVKGKITVVDALISIKNTAVSTFVGMWHQHKESIKEEIVRAVSFIFGLPGALIAGAVNGLVTPAKNESKMVTVLKEMGKATINFLKKDIKIPFLDKIKQKFSIFA